MSEQQTKSEISEKELNVAVIQASQNEVESPNTDTSPKKGQKQTDFEITIETSQYYNGDGKKSRKIPLKYPKKIEKPTGGKNNFIPGQIEFAVYCFETSSPVGDTLDYDSDRNSFVLIVFTITFCMLLITAAGGYLGAKYASNFLIKYALFLIPGASFVLLALSYAILCSACLRTSPCAYLTLVIAVVCMTTVVAVISCVLATRVITLAVIATTITVAICICLACTSIDFTKYILFVIGISAAICAVSILIFILKLFTDWDLSLLQISIVFISTITTIVMIIIELQMILGGKSVEMGEDEHALAAFMLYTSIMQLFFRIIQIIGQLDL